VCNNLPEEVERLVMKKDKFTLGIDYGTESGRVAVVRVLNGEVESSVIVPYPEGVIDAKFPGSSTLEPDWALQNSRDCLLVVGGRSRARLSWQVIMWPIAVVYGGLDPDANYVVRSTGYGQALLRINGKRVEPTINGTQMGQFKEFPVASGYVKDRKVVLTWDRSENEENLNWRHQSRLAEVWLPRDPGIG
jgi:hypothetical protein